MGSYLENHYTTINYIDFKVFKKFCKAVGNDTVENVELGSTLNDDYDKLHSSVKEVPQRYNG